MSLVGWHTKKFDELGQRDQVALILHGALYSQLSLQERQGVDFEVDEFEAKWAYPSTYFYGTAKNSSGTMRSGIKTRFAPGGITSRAKRMAIVRQRQRALIRAGLRTIPPTRFRRTRNFRTGGFLGIEYKFLDCAWNGVTINASTDGSSGELAPSSGCTSAISVPAQGDGESQRDGRKYTIKSVWVSGVVDTTALSDQTDVFDLSGFYFALVLDTQTNAAALNSESVFINPSTSAVAMIPKPLRNLQNSKRFKILASQYVPITGAYAFTDGASTGSLGPQTKPTVNLSWKGNIVCDSVGTLANVSSASDNSISLVGYNASGNITATFIGKSRVRFVG